MRDLTVRRVAILGAGKMGCALAAHLTNLGFSVTLLDASAQTATNALEHVRAGLYAAERAGEIRTGGFEEGLRLLAETDWTIEALPERVERKRALYARIAPLLRPDAIVTTCSSGLPVAELAEGLPEGFTSRFLAASFTLPLSERRLAEVRPGIDPSLAGEFAGFLLEHVARRSMVVPEGPGGIIARYGHWCLLQAIHVAEKLRLDVEDVDAITSLAGIDGGVFGTVDRVGLDELRDVADNLRNRVPNDRGARTYEIPASLIAMIARGWTGEEAGRGYYRREGRERLALDLTTMVYRQAREPFLPGLQTGGDLTNVQRLRAALSGRDEVGEYLREFLLTALRYAEYLREAIGVSVAEIDRTMEWGFGWRQGPFRLLDTLGIGAAPYYDGDAFLTSIGYAPLSDGETFLRLTDLPVIDRSEGFTLRDMGDGVQVLSLHGGVLSPERVQTLVAYLERGGTDRFVLTAEEGDFPTLDLVFVQEAALRDPGALDAYLLSLQRLGEALEGRICVAAIPGRCVGPSLGIALSCAGVVAIAEAEIGFDEARIGFVPTARGTAILRSMHGGLSRRMAEVVTTLTEGFVATNADAARGAGLLYTESRTEFLPERLLETAKGMVGEATARRMGEFAPVEPVLVGLIDRSLAERRGRGALTEFDVAVGQRIRQIVARTGDYEECLLRERKETVDLAGKALTQARLRHLIEVGRVLRN